MVESLENGHGTGKSWPKASADTPLMGVIRYGTRNCHPRFTPPGSYFTSITQSNATSSRKRAEDQVDEMELLPTGVRHLTAENLRSQLCPYLSACFGSCPRAHGFTLLCLCARFRYTSAPRLPFRVGGIAQGRRGLAGPVFRGPASRFETCVFFHGSWTVMRQRIAIVGGGVAGLTAGFLLHEKYDVTLFEQSNRLGGNAWTYVTRDGEAVDIAVAAFGKAGYKHLFKLFSQLKIKTKPYRCYASFHNLDTKTGLYLTPDPRGLFVQRFRVLRPKHVQDVLHLLWAVRTARQLLHEGEFEGITVREGLEKLPYMTGDTRLVFLAALCLFSSMSCEAVLNGPAAFSIKQVDVHNDALSLVAPYSLVGAKDLTSSYVRALALGYHDKIVLNARIRKVIRENNEVVLLTESGQWRTFDKVVLACNADQALAMLRRPTAQEEKLLGAWRFNNDRLVLHRDHSSFPRKPLIQGYSFLYSQRRGIPRISVNGGTWHQPGVSPKCNLISSLNPNFPIDRGLVEFETTLRTPVYDFHSFPTIDQLPSLHGVKNTYYCGSYFGLGLHEDAVRSAMQVAKKLSVDDYGSSSHR